MNPRVEHTEYKRSYRHLPAKLAVNTLKLCPLCESLNSRSNESCFVCGWRGEFDNDPRHLHTSLVLLIESCPELAEQAVFPPAASKFKRGLGRFFFGIDKLKNRLVDGLRRTGRKHVDIRV